MKKIYSLLLLGTLLVLPLMAGPIRVSFRDSTILRGSTVYIPVNIDSSVTGLNVKSYELDISYSAGAMAIDSVITIGSMSQSWQSPAFHLSSGGITIANAGTDPLIGTGVLIYLKLTLPLSSTWGYGSLQFNRVFFNEGSPATTIRNGTIYITNLSVITVSPDYGLLTVGETMQLYVSGGASPYNWSTTDPSVATMSSSGLLTAVHAGFCRVVAVDNNGLRDTTNLIEVRAFKLMVRDTSYLQGQTILLPIYITDLSLVNIYSGTFTVSFDANILTALGIEQTGTLLAPLSSPVTHIAPGSITLAFSGDTSHLHGIGTQILVYILFKITEMNAYGTSLQFSNIMFNENVTGNYRNGSFNVIPRPNLTVSPNTATLVAGDSLQFTVSGGATPPVTWLVTDTTLATISSAGMLKALKSGIIRVSVTDFVGAKGTSGNITLYDVRAQLLNTAATAGDSIDVPLQIGSFPPGIFSTQLTISFNQNYFAPIAIVTSGTLFESRMTAMGTPSQGSVNITAAGATSVSGPGILLKIRFKILNVTPLGSYPVSFVTTLFNEGKPLALTSNGQITVGAAGVDQENSYLPQQYLLSQNYPNPFNPSTTIRYELPQASLVTLKVHNAAGQEVITLVKEKQDAGRYEVEFDGSKLSSGVYFYHLTANDFRQTKKLLLVK